MTPALEIISCERCPVASGSGLAATVRLVAPAVTFTTANWYQAVDITLKADGTFQPAPGSQFVKLFAPASHTQWLGENIPDAQVIIDPGVV